MTTRSGNVTNIAVLDYEIALRNRLIDFIQASDPIRDTRTHEERRRLLYEPGAISAQPALELAPQYVAGPALSKIGLPAEMASRLSYFSAYPALGVFDPPYAHQADAYRAILAEQSDVLVVSGTGSGKTETFLHPILAKLAVEAANDPSRFARHGMRALILYPMNALVSDQVARLRRLFGSHEVKDFFMTSAGVPARFGMYTGRTPYPGVPTASRSREELGAIIRYFLELQEGDPELFLRLQERGRIPRKNLQAVAGALEAGATPVVGPDDVELLTRHEIQSSCPHILVTNYSMLEYMLMRPIERSIFEQTRELYRHDKESMLFVVLDEAHLYRGVAGGEVSFLLSRLLSRLDLNRDRVQFILTSASMGEGETANRDAEHFVYDLVGRPSSKRNQLAIIAGKVLTPPVSNDIHSDTVGALACLPDSFFTELDSSESFSDESLAKFEEIDIHVDRLSHPDKVAQLGHAIDRWAPLVRLRGLVSGAPKSLKDVESSLFPELSSIEARLALRNSIEPEGTLDGRLPVRSICSFVASRQCSHASTLRAPH